MRATTLYLARLFGLFAVIICGWMLLRPASGMSLIQALFSQPIVQLTYAFIALGIGLAMVLGHNHWRGGALTVVVTLLGWLVLLRGLVLLAVPGPAIQSALQAAGFSRVYEIVLGLVLLLGLWLSWAGFSGRSKLAA